MLGKGSQARESGKASNTKTRHGEAEGAQTGNHKFCFESWVGLSTPVNLNMSANVSMPEFSHVKYRDSKT